MRRYLRLVIVAMAAMGCDASQPASSPTTSLDDNAYLQRIVNSTVYNRQAAEIHGGWVSADVRQEIEAVFDRDKVRILEFLLPYMRTFDGNEYPQLTVKVFGLPIRDSDDEIAFHISIKATISPRGKNLRFGGMRPLLDDSYLAHVVWNHHRQVVRETGISGQQCHTVPQAVLDKAIALASARNPACSKERLDRGQIRWFPAWFTRQEPDLASLRTGNNIVRLPFLFLGNDLSHTRVALVSIDTEEGRVLRVEEQIVDFGPRFERVPAPG